MSLLLKANNRIARYHIVPAVGDRCQSGGSFSYSVAFPSRASNVHRAIFNRPTMPFVRKFANTASIVLVIYVYVNIAASEECGKALRQVLVDVKPGKPCAHLGDDGMKYIGWHLPLDQRQQTRAAFIRLGANLDEFLESPATPSDSAVCECSGNVPCLTAAQMKKLLELSVEFILEDTLTLVPPLRNLCCALQRSIFLLAYTSRGKLFSEFAPPIIEYYIETQNWLGLSQLLNRTEWCTRNQDLCTEQMWRVRNGCVETRRKRASRVKRQLNEAKSNVSSTCRGESKTCSFSTYSSIN